MSASGDRAVSPQIAMACELLGKGRKVRFVARGGSMWPALRDGSAVTLVAREPRVGDVAAAVVGGELVLHRVVALDDGHAVLRGDALDGEERVAREAVRGVVERPPRRVPLGRLAARIRRRLLR